jgi:hypothetical protein
MNDRPISPDLAARVTAAEAANADFRRETDAWLTGKGPEPAWSDWAFRLGSELESLTDGLAVEPGPGVVQRGGGWISGPSR